MGAAWVAEADVPVLSGLVFLGRLLLPNPVISVRTYFIAGIQPASTLPLCFTLRLLPLRVERARFL